MEMNYMIILGALSSVFLYSAFVIALALKPESTSKKYYKVIELFSPLIFTILTFCATSFYSIICVVCSKYIWGALASSLFLVCSWCLVEKFYEFVITDFILSENDKNVCNTIALIGVIIFCVIIYIQEKNDICLTMASIVIAIWIGEYVPISDIYQQKSFREIISKIRKTFYTKKRSVFIAPIIFVVLFVLYVIKSDVLQKLERDLQDFGVGFGIGTLLFIVVFVIIQVLKPSSSSNN